MVGGLRSLNPGDVIDRYRIGQVLGEGAMGTVYLAEHELIGRRFALKLLRKELASDPEVVERFMNEARAAGTLGHANICGSTDLGFFDGVPYIVLEYLEGVVLADEIHARGALSARRAVNIARQIASALQAAHSAGVIHRDLKSDNVFLTDADDRPDHVKVLDFGISKFADAVTTQTQRGTLLGTPEFMAPEQVSDADEVDARADIYALGVILYHMLAGAKPFPLDDMRTLLHRIVHEPPPLLVGPAIPPRLIAYVERLMAKDRAARPSSMLEVGDELTAIAELEPLLRRPVSQPVRRIVIDDSSTPIPASTAAATTAPAAIAKPARQRWIAIGLAAIAGAVGLMIAWSSGGGGRDDRAVVQAEPAPAPARRIATTIDATVATPPRPDIGLTLRSDAADAKFTLRRRIHAASDRVLVAPTAVPELVEVTAPGRKTVRYWLTLDREIVLRAHQPAGAGIVEATEHETLIALGEAAGPAPVDPNPPAREPGMRPRREPVAVATRPPGRTVQPPDAGAGRPIREPDAAPAANQGSASVRPAGADPGAGGAANPSPATEPPPKPDPEPSPVRPTIDPAALRAAVRSNIADVQACYERGRMDRPDLAGRVVVKISIAVDGRAVAASVSSSTLQAPTVESCVLKAVRSWRYPPPSGGTVEIAYPFSFQ